MTRQQIHHLAQASLPQSVIAEQAGCSERSVRYVLSEGPPTREEVAADRLTGRGAGAPSKTAPFAEQVSALLSAQPRLPTMEILRRARGEWDYQGGDSAFFNLVRRLRPEAVPVEPLVRFEGLPGEFAQFDFGQVDLVYADGVKDRVQFFAGCLKYSRFKHVEVTENQQAESLVRATINCLDAFGGAPKQWVYDNPKTVWVDRKGGSRILHPYLRQLVVELNVLVEPCSPRSGNQKGAVENLVGFAKKNFFLARTFLDRADMLRQLAEWLRYINFERESNATDEIPAVRREAELCRLNARPIPWTADDFPLRETATVRPTGAVRYRGSGYSVDPRHLGAPATLLVGAKTIRIEVGRTHCEHVRRDFTEEIFRLPEHSLAMATMITAERKQTYFKRQCLLELGPEAQVFLDRLIMKTQGNGWYRDIHRLFDFYQQHGEASLLAAMAEAKSTGEYSARAVSHRLKGVG